MSSAGIVDLEAPATRAADCALGAPGRTASEAPVARRRVLMICSAFPPTGGPGVQRSAKFAKYLRQQGWRPIVWAAESVPDLPRDESLLRDLPADLDVHRTACSDPRTLLQRLQGDATDDSSKGSRSWRSGLAWRIERFLTNLAWKTPPDPLITWALRSRKRCLDLIERERIDAIYSTFSPASNHVLGLLLSRATGLPWVADFRDLWTQDYAYPYSGIRQRIDSSLETLFLREADAVIGVTNSQTEVLAALTSTERSKFVTITNGFDPDDFATIDRSSARSRLHGPDDRFVLTFTGWFLSDRVSNELVEGLTRFASRKGSGFELRIVGAIAKAMLNRLTDAGVDVNATGYVTHDSAIEQMAAADALLLPVPPGPNGETLIPAKTFEYLASGTPILAIGSPNSSEVGAIIRDCSAGVCVESDPHAIETALNAWWDGRLQGNGPAGCQSDRLEPYARDRLTAKLAETLYSVLPVNRRST